MAKKKKSRIRPLALCVFRRGDKIFLARGHDSSKNETFYRPIGGGIEFGERAQDTIIREVKEELDTDVADLRYIGTLENIFVYEGKPGHEIVLLFDGRFLDSRFNEDDFTIQGRDDGQLLFDACWMSLSYFHAKASPPLYPDGLLDLLEDH